MGYQEYIHPYHYYNHDYSENSDSENKLKNVNNIRIDVVCPGCCKPKPPKVSRNKIVNINNINICFDGHKIKREYW